MKEEKMLRAIGGIDDDMVEDAAIHPSHKKQSLVRMPAFRRVVAIAACFVLIIGLAFSMPTLLTPNNDGPGVPIEPGTLLPPNVQENESGLQISGLDQMSYYAAVRMIEGMPKLETLNALVGGYINMEYRLPNGSLVKFLDEGTTYLGNQLESTLESGRCFGIAANADFILVCTYEENGENPELIVYKKR